MSYRFNCFKHDFNYSRDINMKIKTSFVILVLMFSGCSQMDGIYGTGKAVYNVGKEVAPLVPMSEEVRTTLITVDGVASKYDTARSVVRDEKKLDVNTTLVNDE